MSRRILLLVTDLHIGGTPTVVRELAVRLNRGPSVHVHVACLDVSGPTADAIRAVGIAVTPLDASGVLDVGVIWRLIRLIHREKIDTVFSFLIHANVAAAIASPFCGRLRWIQSIQTTQPAPRWHWLAQSLAQHAAEKIVVPSPSVARSAGDWSDIPAEKIVVIPNAVDVDAFEAVRNLPRGKTRIGFLGRLDPVKRVGDLVEALGLLNGDARLEIFGEGNDRAKIASLVYQLNMAGRVKFHGAVKRPQDAFKEIDLLVLPSAAEGFGLVLIEAMAAGVPIVATRVAGIVDVIRDGENGLLTPPANPPALAKTIGRIFADDALRNRLIANGLLCVHERYSWKSIIQQYRELLGFY